ncbi:MAG: pyridoxal phosphate-dependent decarboxylase family protein [Bryobacteraceae bacterium]
MSEFDMPPEEFRRFGYEVVDWIASYRAKVGDMPVLPKLQPGDVMDALPRSAPDEPEPMEQILADFQRQIVPALSLWNHPRFHAYFANSAAGPGILAEALAATVNTNGMLWKSSPGQVELEQVVLNWLRQWLGLGEEFFGEIMDTASTSTMQAIAAARVQADPELRKRGARTGMVVYASEHAHSSVEKGALALGIGQENVRKIGVDAEYRMAPGLLQAAITTDREMGLTPFCVVSTVGTTSVSSIDPVAANQQIAEAEGLWHHVDAAYAGPAAILEENRWMLEGAKRADSLVLNPHKWLFAPMDCSVFYCRKPEMLRRAFSLVPEYLRTNDNERAINFMDYGVALGRRFRALKLWFIFRYFGRKKIEQILRQHIALAGELAEAVRADGRFEMVAPAPLSLVCFRYRGSDDDNRLLIERLNDTGLAFLAGNVLDGRFVIRYAIGNIGTTREDIQMVWAKIQELAGQLHETGAA